MNNLRKAKYEDIIALVALGKLMHEESQFAQYDFDEHKLSHLLYHLIGDPKSIALVYEIDGCVIGGFIGSTAEHYFGSSTYSFDFALFVHPEFRNSRAGYVLLKEYVRVATEEIKVDEVIIGNSTGVESERVEKLFGHMGFTRYGGNWRLRNE